MQYKSDLLECKKIMKAAGKTYYFATKLFPQKIREATYILYAFYRVPDDMVDLNPDLSPSEKSDLLLGWVQKWRDCIKNNGQSEESVLRLAYQIHIEYKIDFAYSEDFLKAMIQDLTKDRYQNYAELEDYMYGSAAVVGIMMTHLIGQKNQDKPSPMVLELASKLGYAMQLTNFLRDINEDIDERSRIYLPLDELKLYGIAEQELLQKKYALKWTEFMECQLNRADQLYKQADAGIKQLNWYGRLAVRVASRLYQAYHTEIRNSEYRVFESKYKISKLKRLFILIKNLYI
jgi:phytoene synthase